MLLVVEQKTTTWSKGILQFTHICLHQGQIPLLRDIRQMNTLIKTAVIVIRTTTLHIVCTMDIRNCLLLLFRLKYFMIKLSQWTCDKHIISLPLNVGRAYTKFKNRCKKLPANGTDVSVSEKLFVCVSHTYICAVL